VTDEEIRSTPLKNVVEWVMNVPSSARNVRKARVLRAISDEKFATARGAFVDALDKKEREPPPSESRLRKMAESARVLEELTLDASLFIPKKQADAMMLHAPVMIPQPYLLDNIANVRDLVREVRRLRKQI